MQKNKLDWHKEANILNGIAGVYFEERNYKKAREIAYKCYTTATSNKDSSLSYTCALDMALIANKEKKFNEAIKYIKEAQTYEKRNYKKRSRSLAVEAETMFLQKNMITLSTLPKSCSTINMQTKIIKVLFLYTL